MKSYFVVGINVLSSANNHKAAQMAVKQHNQNPGQTFMSSAGRGLMSKEMITGGYGNGGYSHHTKSAKPRQGHLMKNEARRSIPVA